MTPNTLRTWPSRTDLDLWVRRGCALVVAGVAAYASYEHQREFAVRGGADPTGAALWPLSVDGLLVLATVGQDPPSDLPPHRVVVWLSFLLGIAVSLAAKHCCGSGVGVATGPGRRVATGGAAASCRTASPSASAGRAHRDRTGRLVDKSRQRERNRDRGC
jgi:uncharacterized protein DUF2637